jgi:hypothetical protein
MQNFLFADEFLKRRCHFKKSKRALKYCTSKAKLLNRFFKNKLSSSEQLAALVFGVPRYTQLNTVFWRCPGGVAQWTSHLPQEQKTRVQIPPGYKVFGKKHSNAVAYNWLNMHALFLWWGYCSKNMICIHTYLSLPIFTCIHMYVNIGGLFTTSVPRGRIIFLLYFSLPFFITGKITDIEILVFTRDIIIVTF